MTTRRTTAKASAKPTAKSIYQLKITLRGSKPPIWRRVQTVGGVTLAELHAIIQVAMGWNDDHLHEFEVGRVRYGEPEDDMLGFGMDLGVKDESRARLYKIAPTEGKRFQYVYDLGDSWEHSILVEKILAPEPGAQYPRCLAGRRACPPEDCGGIWGYEALLETLQHPESPDYAEISEWLETDFDPEAFSVEEVNEEFSMLSTLAALDVRQRADGMLEIGDVDVNIAGSQITLGTGDLAEMRGVKQPIEIPLDQLGYRFKTPPLLIGGMAMEYYGLRAAGADIDFVVTRDDYAGLAALYPTQLQELAGDLGVVHERFELWTSAYRFDYDALAVDAIDSGAYRVISLEKLLLLKALSMAQAKSAIDMLLLVDRILARQYGRA